MEKMHEAKKFEKVGKNKTDALFTTLNNFFNKAKSSKGDLKKLKFELESELEEKRQPEKLPDELQDELQIKLEQIMLERSMERMIKKSMLESEPDEKK